MRDISDQTTVVNREAVFECEIKINYPEITLSWYKGTQRLDNSDKYEIKIVGNRHIMKIKNCQSSDQGNYRVVCGPHISSAKLTVQGMYTGMRLFIIWCQYSWVGYLLFSWQTKFNHEFNNAIVILLFTEARVEAHLEETAGKEGQTCTLTCQFSIPNVKTQWFKNGKRLEASSRYSFTVIDQIQRLTIKDVRPEDQGEYTCKYDNLETSTNLWIEGLYTSNESLTCRSNPPTNLFHLHFSWRLECLLDTSLKIYRNLGFF